jgi:NADPH-dependent 2,4-dienoyl-CoA reductase/sulfur reductase-like enzyme
VTSDALPQRIVIVGGGPAALATARAYRAAGGRGDVTMLAAERYLPYRRPPLTKDYLRGEMPPEELTIEPPSWFAEHRVLVRHESAIALDPDGRLVASEGGTLAYDACVLATGCAPARPPVPGADDPGVLTMRTRDDSERLRQVTGPGVRVALIGSGFIGCEAAASLRRRGAEVVLVSDDVAPQSSRLGREAAERIADWLDEDGVELRLGSPVEQIEPDADRWTITTESGHEVRAAVVLLGAGVSRNDALPRAAGLELTDCGAVTVDAGLRSTSDPAISVAGDLAAPLHPRVRRRLTVDHWGAAVTQGAVVGRRLAGDEDARWDGAPGFWSTIGPRTLKHVAWGDGFDEARFVSGENGAFTVWYGRDGVAVGVLTHGRDEDHDRGRELVEAGAPLPRA